jgi:acyl carrier protein
MSIQDEIAKIVSDVCPSISVEPERYDNSLFDTGIDSLDHATILLQVEEKFDVKIPDDVVPGLVSVSLIAKFVANAKG